MLMFKHLGWSGALNAARKPSVSHYSTIQPISVASQRGTMLGATYQPLSTRSLLTYNLPTGPDLTLNPTPILPGTTITSGGGVILPPPPSPDTYTAVQSPVSISVQPQCPTGEVYDAQSNMCVKPAPTTQTCFAPTSCMAGMHWDCALSVCVNDTTGGTCIPQACPSGQHWDCQSMSCVPVGDGGVMISCQAGFFLNPSTNQCEPMTDTTGGGGGGDGGFGPGPFEPPPMPMTPPPMPMAPPMPVDVAPSLPPMDNSFLGIPPLGWLGILGAVGVGAFFLFRRH